MSFRKAALAALGLLLAGGASASPVPPTSVIELESGKGFLARAESIVGGGSGQIRNTHWVEMRVQPFRDHRQLRPFGAQLGLQQSEDAMRTTACRIAPSIAGENYCGQADSDAENGANFTALYAGLQTDLVELTSTGERPLKVMLGAGATLVRHIALEGPRLLPYSSIQLGYRLQKGLHARAGAFVSYLSAAGGLAISAPAIELEYRF
ncbi:MAG: hypothetical protein NDJ90_05750 [Oligoflexia bacterium]|nr:hypothetical protein [Oligoflexia bacterium]